MKVNEIGICSVSLVVCKCSPTIEVSSYTSFKVGVKVNLSEILRVLKKGLFLEHHQTVDPNARAPQVVRGLFECPSTNF